MIPPPRARPSERGSHADPETTEEDPEGEGRGLLEFALILALCVVLMFGVVRPFVAEVFRIPSESMSPTLEAGDSVLTLKFAYRLAEPERGDLAVFDGPDGATIKRVVGLPGDTVGVRDGVLVVNGKPKREPYVDYNLTDSSFFGPEKVPEGHFFVMGDNRSNSRDSRAFGPVPEEDLTGEVLLRVAPLDRIGAP